VCDSPAKSGYRGWRGWSPLPATRIDTARGDWVDLTYPLSPDVPRVASFAAPTFTRIAEMPAQPLNVTRMDTIVHMGTHLDAPRHFFLDGPSMEAIPLERMMGRGVVLHIEKAAYGVIEPADLEHASNRVEAGDIVAIDTGWGSKWGTREWDQQPCLSVAAARWLLDRRVKLLAVDTPTPDLPLDRRAPDFSPGRSIVRCSRRAFSSLSSSPTSAALRDSAWNSSFARCRSRSRMAHRRACWRAPWKRSGPHAGRPLVRGCEIHVHRGSYALSICRPVEQT
jgi:arylformamidase